MTRLAFPFLIAAILGTPASPLRAEERPVPGLKVPPGFVVEEYAGHTLAESITHMTIDAEGRVLVGGRGYVRVLVDDNGDGRADRAVDILDNLTGQPMGLLAEGDSLFVVVKDGFKRYRGYDGRTKLSGKGETVLNVRAGGEHDAHAVRRGPDGWLYLSTGNMAEVTKSTVTSPRSPVKDPVAGVVLRISPDGKQVEVVADGFRNIYDFDFDERGELFTYDSDNERCVSLPWYEPCRFYHVVSGGNYGWLAPQHAQFWRKPPYFLDVVPPVCTTGRGSPTGCICYKHTAFPAPYRGEFFLADWTFGRIYFVKREARGSSFTAKPEVFLDVTGDNGFAPTALAVHPKTGELFVSIGGRGTRGGVYRIRYTGATEAKPGATEERLPPPKRSLDWDETRRKETLATAVSKDQLARRAALDDISRHFDKFQDLKFLVKDIVEPNLQQNDRLIRAAAARIAVQLPAEVQVAFRNRFPRPTSDDFWLATAMPNDATWANDITLDVLEMGKRHNDEDLEAIRVLQIVLGDLGAPKAIGTVWEGYTLRKPVDAGKAKQLRSVLFSLLPARDYSFNREATRLLAALGTGNEHSLNVITEQLTETSSPIDDTHILIVLSRLEGPRTQVDTRRIAEALLRLDPKLEKAQLSRDTFWPLRVGQAAAALCQLDKRLPAALIASPLFGRPDHVLFATLPGVDTAAAARKFQEIARMDADFGWTTGLVGLLGSLPESESLPLLRKLWDNAALQDTILPLLARKPAVEDRAKFLAGLKSYNPSVVALAAKALAAFPPAANPDEEQLAAARALRRAGNDKSSLVVREALAALLHRRTGQTLGADPKAWEIWLARERPDLAKQLTAATGFDASAWKKRLAPIDWAAGDPANGQKVFVRATCIACHNGPRAIGPSLEGVAKRFSRDDLLTAILEPNKDVPPRYRPLQLTTTDGKVYVGMVAYEATDGYILQTGADSNVRVLGSAIESKRTLDVSLMPAGLLDKLADRDIADLLAYLRTLTDKPAKRK